LHGLPISIVLDRGTKFVGNFWRTLWKNLRTNISLSLSYHPQTYGNIEVVNHILGNLLRILVSEHRSQRNQFLVKVEFSYNDSPNRSTGKSPFQIVYVMHPRGISKLRDMGKEEMRSDDAEDFSTTM
jgi:hypothetical protein